MFSQDEFVWRLGKVNSNITVLGRYTGTKNKIKVRCENNHVWEARANSLLAGHGCPYCSGRYLLTQDEFVDRLKKVNPTFTVTGKYIGAQDIIEVMCSKGHKWKAIANALLHDKGCPHCKSELMRDVMIRNINSWK